MTDEIRLESAHGIRLVSSSDLAPHDMSDDKVNIEQFTGLIDKNGKGIYEGDLVRYSQVYELPQEIQFEAGCYIFGDEMLGALADKVEVIGNIHENPDLLKPTNTTQA